DGVFTLSARTSGGGPGYHAWLIALVDRLKDALGLAWADADGDETGYAEHRDFARLQQEHLTWLRAVAEQTKDAEQAAINMPLDFSVLGDHFAATPRGFLDREGLLVPERFFAWWSEGHTPAFWQGLAETLAWSVLPWHVPTEEERPLYEAARAAFKRSPVVY